MAPSPNAVFLISTKLPIRAPAPISAPGRRRANGPMMAPGPTRQCSRWLKARISAPSAISTPGPRMTLGADYDVAAQRRVPGEEHGLRRGHGGAAQHRGAPCLGLEGGLGLRQLHPVVDAQRLRLAAAHHAGAQVLAAGQPDHVGQVVFALGVVVADPGQQVEQGRAVGRDDAGVAGADGTFFLAGVPGLDDPLQRAAGAGDHAAITAGLRRLETEGDKIGAPGPGRDHGAKRFGRDEGGVGEQDEDIAGENRPARVGPCAPRGRCRAAPPVRRSSHRASGCARHRRPRRPPLRSLCRRRRRGGRGPATAPNVWRGAASARRRWGAAPSPGPSASARPCRRQGSRRRPPGGSCSQWSSTPYTGCQRREKEFCGSESVSEDRLQAVNEGSRRECDRSIKRI